MESIVLHVNGKDISLFVEKNWTLLYTLRECLQLTGAKCGCSTGDCGACKVIVDGEAVNSCLLRAVNMQGKNIETIEGLADGTKLHPVQQAFVETGAIQCGYCTPGMILSVKALLDRNPDPTEEEIRKAISNNLCRCTGYVKIVEAARRAAQLLHEKNEQAASGTEEMNSLIGGCIPVHDAVRKATGEFLYTADLTFPRMLHAKILFSPKAHARIRSIDISEAEALPGVAAVICYQNTPEVRFNSCGECIDEYKTERVFDDVMRYVGDRVAAVAADTEAIASKALRLIRVEYEDLPFYIDPEEAAAADAYPIHEDGELPEIPNAITRIVQEAGNVDAAMKTADYIFEDCYEVPAIHHSAIETHASIASYTLDGKLTVYSPSQDVFAYRTNLSRIFGLPMNRVRVVSPGIGGGFGGKIDMVIDPVTAALAIRTGRTVKLVYNRMEDIASSRTRHAMKIRLRTGVMSDGTIVAEDQETLVNAGAYAGATTSIVWAMAAKYFRNHKTANIRFTGVPVYTNTPIAAAMRGYGSPQEFFAQQCQMNKIAKKLGISMQELQRKNLVEPHAHEPIGGRDIGNAMPLKCVSRVEELFGWDEEVREQEISLQEKGRYRIGVGMAVAAHGNGMFGVCRDTTGVILKMNEDGSATMLTGVSDMGNGSVTAQRQVVAEILGIPMDKISIAAADTELTMYDLGNYSSRGSFVSVKAAMRAAQKVKAEMERGVPLRDICCSECYDSDSLAMSYGAHCAKVRVDTQTGEIKVLKYAAVHDVGRVLNYMNIEGQLEGAIQMGLGYALTEGLEYNANGKVANGSFRKYHILNAEEMPPILIDFVEEGGEDGPFSAKSIGECGVVPVAGAVANAVTNALGCEIHRLPMKPEMILELIRSLDDADL